jgi:DNA polymerase-1
MAEQEDVVYLVDGSSYIHRAYHAIRNLSNSKGLPTNAVFGFSRMLLKLLEEEKPRYLAIVLDAKGPTFRHVMSEEYKATRPPMAEELQTQIPYIKAVLEGLNLKVMEKQGFEADDVIGTLARIAEEENFRVVVVSGDKDFRQILTPRTTLWDTMKDTHLDYQTFTSEVGLKPEQMVDVMGLSGDVSDNIPGVKGIGEKTAIDLVKQFGSLEEVFHHLDQVKRERVRENLRKWKDDAILSKKLVIIERFVPLEEKVADLEVGIPDPHKLAEIFRELEFRDLVDLFFQREETGERTYGLLLSAEDVTVLARQVEEKGIVGVALQTAGEDPLVSDLVGMAFSCDGDLGWYLPLAHAYPGAPEQPPEKKALGLLKSVMEDESIHKVSRRLKHDSLVLRRRGIEFKGLYFDTTVASYVINPGLRQHDLSSSAQQFLNHKMMSYGSLTGKKVRHLGEVEVQKVMAYACEEAVITLRLRDVMDEKLASEMNRTLFYDLEMQLIPVLADMEWAGIKLDIEFFKDLSRQFSEELTSMEKEIYEEAGMEFNIQSPQQLGYVLFEKLGLPAQKKTSKTKAYSTDVKVLTKLSALPYKIPKVLLRYRTLSKLKSTYLDALVSMVHPDTGRIHTSFNQTVAATGRLSSSSPNLQNIPSRGEEGREIRKGFVAEKGYRLLSADYSQVELRVFAHYSKDPAFLEAFKKEEDIHARTASEMLGVPAHAVTPAMRRMAKAINFGIIYGMGPQKLSEELGIDLTLAKGYMSAYLHQYPGVTKYREEAIASARRNGYVSTLFKRRRYLPGINHKNRIIRGEAERMAMNTPIQGTAADLIKKAMIRIHDRLKKESLETRMLLQVHDELLFETPENEVERIASMVKEEMEGVYTLEVPLKVDLKTGYNWDEAH